MHTAHYKARRGVILVFVVGILAILMLMAATLAVLAQIEQRTSRYYEQSQALDALIVATQNLAGRYLHEDKFGADGAPYDHEKLEALPSADRDAILTAGLYPLTPTAPYASLEGDDEGFDWPGEEWLPGADAYRDFSGAANDAELFDTDGDGILDVCAIWLDAETWLERDYGAPLGQGVMVQFALYFMDAGSGRADLNSIGNLQGTTVHRWMQGLTPYECSLEAALQAIGTAGPATTAAALIKSRYGADQVPGGLGNDSDMLGVEGFDFNSDGEADYYTLPQGPVNEPTEFNPEFPAYSAGGDPLDEPFGPFDLDDFVWGKSAGSRSAAVLWSAFTGTDQDKRMKLREFTTRSATTVMAARSFRVHPNNLLGTPTYDANPNVAGLQTAFDETNTDGAETLTALAAYEPMQLGTWPASQTTERDMLLQRSIPKALGLEAADIHAGLSPEDVYDFLWAMGPFVLDSGGNHLAEDDAKVIVRQVATVLNDMVDENNDVTVWSTGGRTYYGVEVTPYVVEGEAEIDTALHPYKPNNDGSITGAGNVRDALGSETNLPPCGWGRHVKLVNPWPTPIDLSTDRYRLQIEGGRRWVYTEPSGPWVEQAHNGPFTSSDLEGSLPARGHYVIVDSLTDPNGADVYATTAGGTPPTDSRFEWKDLTYMRGGVSTLRLQHYQWVGPGVDPDDPSDDVYGYVTIMETALPAASGESSTDGDGSSDGQPLSVKMQDPRPCWIRWSAGSSAPVFQGLPWGADAWLTGSNPLLGTYCFTKTLELGATGAWEWPNTDMSGGEWFNMNWKHPSGTLPPDPAAQTKTGDRLWLLDTNVYSMPDNLLYSFPPAGQAVAADTDVYSYACVRNEEIMNSGRTANPGYLGYVHSGIEWGTVSLSVPASPGDFGEAELVYLRNVGAYLTGPFSPYEDGQENDGDEVSDAADTGAQAADRDGPEMRARGKINVNMASKEVIMAALSQESLASLMQYGAPATRADALAAAIVAERANGPFASVDDVLERVPELFEVGDAGAPNCARREALARFICNNLTIRTDVWAVVGRARFVVDANGDGSLSASEIQQGTLVDRRFYFVLDRSYDPVRVIIRRLLP